MLSRPDANNDIGTNVSEDNKGLTVVVDNSA